MIKVIFPISAGTWWRGVGTGLLLLLATAAQAQLSGTYYVGTSTSPNTSRTYTSLPAAIMDLSSNGVSAGTSATFVLLDATYDLASTSLTVPAPAGSVTIRPNTGVSPVITGSNTGATIVLNGTDNLTLTGDDGSGTTPPNTTLTIRNTLTGTTGGPAVRLQNDATYNTLLYLTLESAGTANTGTNSVPNYVPTTGTLYFGTTNGTTGNSNNTVQNCSVRAVNNSDTALPSGAIYSAGTGATNGGVPAATANSSNTVQACSIYNFSAGGVYLSDTGSGGSWTMSGNNLYQTAARNSVIRAIRLAAGSGHVVTNNNIYQVAGSQSSVFYGIVVSGGAAGATVTGNYVGGSAVGATGNAMSVNGTEVFYGMYFALGTSATSSIQNNTVTNITSTTTGTFYGIDVAAGQLAIGTTTANTIGSTTSGQGISAASNLYGIEVDGSTAATVQNNTIAGLSTSAGNLAGVYLSGSGVSPVSTNTISTLSSTAGSGTLVAGVYLTSSGASSISNNTISSLSATVGAAVNGVYLTAASSAATTVSGNTISNLSGAQTTAALLAGIRSVGTGTVVISTNKLSNLTQSNLSTGLSGILSNSVAGSNVTDNILTTITYSGTSTGGTVVGISAGGNNTVSGNSVSGISTTGSAANTVYGLSVGGVARATPTITGNTITGVQSAATGSAATAGLYVAAASGALGAATVSTNLISNVGTTNTASTSSTEVVSGLLLGDASGSVTEGNRIWNVYGSTAGTGTSADQVRGLAVQGSYSGTLDNNEISLAAGATGQLSYGILDLSSGGTITYYYNSVYLAPASSGAATSYGFYRSATSTPPTVSLRNNLLYNGRPAASGASAYAIGTASTTGWASTTSNYGLLISPAATAVGNYGGTGYSFAGWKTATGGDASSLSTTPATLAAANLFIDPSITNGNLNLIAANKEAWYANGNGVQLSGQTADYRSLNGGPSANRSTTVTNGAPDIGAAEFTPTSMPPTLDVSGAPALGGSQTFSLGGRPLATITYGTTGTVPTSTTGQYYSGTNPPAPYVAGAKFANTYFVFADANNNGSGYTYQPVLYYDPALLGTISGETTQQLNPRKADNSGYQSYATTVNTTARTLTGPTGVTRLGLLAISDQAAPLPVTLVAFTAQRVASGTQLDWLTASETNSQGFEVQASSDGGAFQALGFVASHQASSATAQTYQFVAASPSQAGPQYYRLKQLDLAGTFTYSPVRTVRFETTAAGLALLAAPNPFDSELTLTLATPATGETISLAIIDLAGRVVVSQSVTLPAGASTIHLTQLAGLPDGAYLVRLLMAGGVQRTTISKH